MPTTSQTKIRKPHKESIVQLNQEEKEIFKCNKRADLVTPFLKSTLQSIGEHERMRTLNSAAKEAQELLNDI